MSIDEVHVGVLGATGVAAESLLAALAQSRFSRARVSAYASGRGTDRVDYGEGALPVQALTAVGETELDLVFCCLPLEVARRTLPGLIGRGALVVDVGDALGEGAAPLALPGVQLPDPREVARAGAVRTPSPAGWLLAGLAAPLRGSLASMSGVLALPAAAWGRKAVEELSEQVVASFNLKDPPRRIFPEGLAFDTLLDDSDEEEWSFREALAASEVEALAGVLPGVQIVTQPLFAGMSAGLHLRGVDADAVRAAWEAAPLLRAVQRSPNLRPRKAMGKRSIFYGGIRPDPAGDGVHLWAVADPATGAAGAAPVAVAEWLVDSGLVGGPLA